MATDAAPTRSGRAPKAFVNRTRTRSPPAVKNATLRTVWLFKPLSAGQLKAPPGMVPPGTGLPCQAFTQRGPPCLLSQDPPEATEPSVATPRVAAAGGVAGTETVASTAEAATSAAPVGTDRRLIPIPFCANGTPRGAKSSGGQHDRQERRGSEVSSCTSWSAQLVRRTRRRCICGRDGRSAKMIEQPLREGASQMMGMCSVGRVIEVEGDIVAVRRDRAVDAAYGEDDTSSLRSMLFPRTEGPDHASLSPPETPRGPASSAVVHGPRVRPGRGCMTWAPFTPSVR
jgi:hypothetical protein